MTFLENGLIDNDLWQSDEWAKFYHNNLDIIANIKEVFITNQHFSDNIRLSTAFIAETLNKDPKFIHLLLAIWCRHYCTFYKSYGRVHYNTDNNRWVYIVD